MEESYIMMSTKSHIMETAFPVSLYHQGMDVKDKRGRRSLPSNSRHGTGFFEYPGLNI